MLQDANWTNVFSPGPRPISYIITTADRHVGVARGHPLSRAGARQMVVVDTAGVVAGDRGEGVQRQVLVQQTAGETRGEGDRP